MKHVKLSIALAATSIAILLAGCSATSSAKSTASNAKVEITTEATDTSIESTEKVAESFYRGDIKQCRNNRSYQQLREFQDLCLRGQQLPQYCKL